jgi:hypothetical protein
VFPIAASKPWFQDASFEYHKPYFTDNLNVDLEGGPRFFKAKIANEGGPYEKTLRNEMFIKLNFT